MKRVLKWIGVSFVVLAGLVVAGYGAIHILSEGILGRVYPVPATGVAIPTDAASIAEGRRLATLRGCYGGCHGREAEGAVMLDKPMIARIVAPNLTAAVRKRSDAQLVAAIRNGVRPDGRSMIAMPSESFVALSDQDVGRIIAFLKSLPAVPGTEAGVTPGPLGRFGIVTGKFKPIAQLMAESAPPPPAKDSEASLGRYMAWTTCGSCHGPDLRGASNPSFTSPDLRVAAAYSPEAFTKLLRTGVAIGDRSIPVMGEWSRRRLAHLTNAEIAALHAYLHALPAGAAK